jgi:hypothetical protein
VNSETTKILKSFTSVRINSTRRILTALASKVGGINYICIMDNKVFVDSACKAFSSVLDRIIDSRFDMAIDWNNAFYMQLKEEELKAK